MKGEQSTLSSISMGVVTAIFIVLIGSVITSMLLHFTAIQESSMPVFTYTVSGISLVSGGYTAGRRAGSKGWYYGGLTGIFYFLIMVLIGFLAFDIAVQFTSLLYLLGMSILSGIGGILGVNIASR